MDLYIYRIYISPGRRHSIISKKLIGKEVYMFPGGSDSKKSACNADDPDSIPGLRRSPGEGNGYPFQYSGLDNSMDCRVAKSRT